MDGDNMYSNSQLCMLVNDQRLKALVERIRKIFNSHASAVHKLDFVQKPKLAEKHLQE